MFSVIIAGGKGSRLWPLSTPDKPKPLLEIADDKTLLELSIERLSAVTPVEKIFMVITANIEEKVRRIIGSFPPENVISEPLGKNTTPCVALAARKIIDIDSDAVIGIFPVDHVINKRDRFYDCLRVGELLATEYDRLVLLGLKPDKPSPGYGYIILGDRMVSGLDQIKCYEGRGFTEKPDMEKAARMIKEENVLWNSGIYIGRASRFLEEIKTHAPETYEKIDRYYNDYNNLKKAYENFTSISFDYSVAEKLDEFMVIEANIGRIDVGNFNSLHELWAKDLENNAVNGDYVCIKAANNIIFSREKTVAVMGINDMIIIDTPHNILVCPRDKALEVDKLREKLIDERDGSGRKNDGTN